MTSWAEDDTNRSKSSWSNCATSKFWLKKESQPLSLNNILLPGFDSENVILALRREGVIFVKALED